MAIFSGSGCDRPPADEPFAVSYATAAVAFAGAELAAEQPDDSAVPIDDSPPEPESAERSRRVLLFTADWCAACRGNDRTLAALRSAGWSIGPQSSSHVQIVDFDEEPELRCQYGVTVVPTWVLIEDGRELRRSLGVLDPFAVGRLFEDS